MLPRTLLITACIASGACTSTYHPEYHPVTVTTVHQSVSAQGVAPTTRAATSGVTPIVIQQPELANPEVFFEPR